MDATEALKRRDALLELLVRKHWQLKRRDGLRRLVWCFLCDLSPLLRAATDPLAEEDREVGAMVRERGLGGMIDAIHELDGLGGIWGFWWKSALTATEPMMTTLSAVGLLDRVHAYIGQSGTGEEPPFAEHLAELGAKHRRRNSVLWDGLSWVTAENGEEKVFFLGLVQDQAAALAFARENRKPSEGAAPTVPPEVVEQLREAGTLVVLRLGCEPGSAECGGCEFVDRDLDECAVPQFDNAELGHEGEWLRCLACLDAEEELSEGIRLNAHETDLQRRARAYLEKTLPADGEVQTALDVADGRGPLAKSR
jgi:hypothetical protein